MTFQNGLVVRAGASKIQTASIVLGHQELVMHIRSIIGFRRGAVSQGYGLTAEAGYWEFF